MGKRLILDINRRSRCRRQTRTAGLVLAIAVVLGARPGAGEIDRAAPRLATDVPSLSLGSLAAAATPARSLKPRTIAVVHHSVDALAQSKGRLAWFRGSELCPKAEILDLRSRRRVTISSGRGPACYIEDSDFEHSGLFALDGNRVLWEGIDGEGNTEVDVELFTAALRDRRTRTVLRTSLARYEGGGLDYEPYLPIAGTVGHLIYYDRCEVLVLCKKRTSAVKALRGRRSYRLFTATRPVGLAVAGRRLAVLEDRLGCCQYTPAWSPDGMSLAWVVVPEYRRLGFDGPATELVTANADGSGRRTLAESPEIEGPPSWAPDGSKLVFASLGGKKPLLEIVSADGTSRRTIGTGRWPQWSPDGTQIAFVRDGDVYRVNGDGSQETRLTNDPVEGAGPPRWSPDGKKLLLEQDSPDSSRAYVVDAAAGGATALAPPDAQEPIWSPDGTRIAFIAPGARIGESLAVMNADGSNVHLLTDSVAADEVDLDPAWSSNSAKIAFGRWDTGAIFVVNADGTDIHRVNGTPNAASPAWAPNRPTVAWGDDHDDHLGPSYRTGGLFLANASGSGRVRVAGADEAVVEIRDARTGALRRSLVEPGTAVAVAISAKYIAAVVQMAGSLELHRLRSDGSALGIDKLPAGINPFFLTVGARTIVYSTRRRIFAVDAETGKAGVLARPAAPPVGLSILNRRVVWAENLGRDRARVRAIDLPG